MGIAAYNRGSRVLRERLDREARPLPRPIRTAPPAPSAPTGWQPGDKAFCTVRGPGRGWYTVTAVKGDRLKVAGVGGWCPAYNFSRKETPS